MSLNCKLSLLTELNLVFLSKLSPPRQNDQTNSIFPLLELTTKPEVVTIQLLGPQNHLV